MKIAEYKQMMAYLTRPKFNGGGSVGSFVKPKRKPKEEAEKVNKARKEKTFEKAKPALENPKEVKEMIDKPKRGLVDEPGSYGGAKEGPAGSPAIRKYLNSVKKGSTVDVGAYLDKFDIVKEPERSNATAAFKRIAPEFENKNLNLKYRSVSEALREPLSKQFKKVANHFFKDEIAKYDSMEDWAYAKENRSDRLEIIRGITTKGKKGIVIGRYKKPKADLKIKASYDPKTKKVIGVSFPSKEMEEKFIEKIKEVYTKPKGKGYSSKDFARDFPVNANTANKIINDYYQPEKKMGLKYPKGKTVGKSSTQIRSEKLGDTSVDAVERAILKEKRELSKDLGLTRPVKGRAGTTERTSIDLAHRISKDHAKALGLKFGTETTGFDSRLINQVILRPVERELEILYAKQRKLRTQFQEGKAPKDYVKQMNNLNAEINKQIKLTNGRMIGVNIDPNTNEVSFTGQKKKFKLSNLDLTFEQIKDLPKNEKQKIITDSVLKGVEAEKARGFRPYDFKTLLSSPERRKEVLKYAKKNAPDIFSKVKQAISNPTSKRRFALYSKLPAAFIPAGMTLAFLGQSGEAQAATPKPMDFDLDMSLTPKKESSTKTLAGALGAALTAGTQKGRDIAKKVTSGTLKGFGKAFLPLGTPTGTAAIEKAYFFDPTLESLKKGEKIKSSPLQNFLIDVSLPISAVAPTAKAMNLFGPSTGGFFKRTAKDIAKTALGGGYATRGLDALSRMVGLQSKRLGPGVVSRAVPNIFRAATVPSIYAAPLVETAIQGYNAYKRLEDAKEKYGMDDTVTTALGQAPRKYVQELISKLPEVDRSGAAGGGIMKMAGKSSGPPPESGPTPQGLDFLMKRGR